MMGFLMHQCTFVNKAHTHLWRWSWPGLHWSPWRVPSWVLGPVGLTPSRVLAPVLCCCGLGKLRDSPGTLEGSTHHIPQDVGSPGVPLPHRPQEASMHTCLHPLQMDLCSRSWRWVVPEAGGKQASPPHLSRVNGWSRPLHSFQVVAWATFLILAVANFGIFIPFLPHNWKYVAYGVTGGLFFLHFLVHLITVSIDPAEANVRLKNYSEPMPTFDQSKHTHVIQNQYCHLCELTL
uniref:Uncharacterized protein n=2 Tax=Canis lupus familiaris TaxID=9615 RepID=A0A8I3Q1D3_CANLF